jgi:hypothetical protein
MSAQIDLEQNNEQAAGGTDAACSKWSPWVKYSLVLEL